MTIYIGGAEPTQHEHSLLAEAELEHFCVSELDNAKIKAMDDLGRYWYVTIKATLAPSDEYDKEELAGFVEHFEEQDEATAQHAPTALRPIAAGDLVGLAESPTMKPEVQEDGSILNVAREDVVEKSEQLPEKARQAVEKIGKAAIADARVYIVDIKRIAPEGHLLDMNVPTEWKCLATSEDDALDKFHRIVPIKVLDHFDIVAYPAPTYWGEDKLYPSEAWRAEVANDETRQGYWEWVKNCGAKDNPDLIQEDRMDEARESLADHPNGKPA